MKNINKIKLKILSLIEWGLIISQALLLGYKISSYFVKVKTFISWWTVFTPLYAYLSLFIFIVLYYAVINYKVVRKVQKNG